MEDRRRKSLRLTTLVSRIMAEPKKAKLRRNSQNKRVPRIDSEKARKVIV